MREVLMIIALVIISFVFLLQVGENICLVIESEQEERKKEKAKQSELGAGERYG